jgi:hypothetical protein
LVLQEPAISSAKLGISEAKGTAGESPLFRSAFSQQLFSNRGEPIPFATTPEVAECGCHCNRVIPWFETR